MVDGRSLSNRESLEIKSHTDFEFLDFMAISGALRNQEGRSSNRTAIVVQESARNTRDGPISINVTERSCPTGMIYFNVDTILGAH